MRVKCENASHMKDWVEKAAKYIWKGVKRNTDTHTHTNAYPQKGEKDVNRNVNKTSISNVAFVALCTVSILRQVLHFVLQSAAGSRLPVALYPLSVRRAPGHLRISPGRAFWPAKTEKQSSQHQQSKAKQSWLK